ncbi:TolC family protein [Francisellaceae bacterium]|nr:TolC family protein [Francisellaceae bacterium]
MKTLTLSLVTLLLSGCFLMGPDYKKPDADVPQEWISEINHVEKNSVNLPYLAWWESYNDPTLNELIAEALKANNDIQIAFANLEAAHGQLDEVELGWLPTFSFQGGFSQMPNLGNPGTYIAVFPAYIINLFTQYKKQQYAELNVELAEFAVSAVKLDIISEVTRSYFIYLSQEYLYSEIVNLENTISDLLELTNAELVIGLNNDLSITPLKVQLYNIRAQEEIFKHNIIASSNALRFLLNKNPGEIIHEKTFSELKVMLVDYVNIPTTVLADRPDVAYAETNLKMANTAIGIASSSFLPSINLMDFLGYASPEAGEWRKPTEGINLEQAIATIDIDPTVFGEINVREGQYQSAYYEYIKTVRKVLEEVDTAISANNRFTRSYYNQVEAYQAQDAFYALQIGLYESGLASMLPVVLAQSGLIQQQMQLTQNKLQQLLSVVSLYQNLGGGYAHGQSAKDQKEEG